MAGRCLCGDRHHIFTFVTSLAVNDNAASNIQTVVPFEVDDRFCFQEPIDDSPGSGFFFIP